MASSFWNQILRCWRSNLAPIFQTNLPIGRQRKETQAQVALWNGPRTQRLERDGRLPMSEPQASVKSKISRSGRGRRRMSTSGASDFETPRPSHRGKVEKAAIVAAKLLVTGACFWYVSRQIDWRQVSSAISLLDF